MGVHFGTPVWSKKNAQKVSFEHFGTFWYPGYAEREGFEPPDLLQSLVFKTSAFDHSAISPVQCGGKSKHF